MQMSTSVIDRNEDLPFAEEVRLDFDPVVDGFGFANVFVWTDADLEQLTSELAPIMWGATIGSGALLGRAIAGSRGFVAGSALGGILAFSEAPQSWLKSLAKRWPTFGLCGGMALRSKERWLSRSFAPTYTLSREEIRSDLRKAQSETLRASWSRFLILWLQARAQSLAVRDTGTHIRSVKIELGKIRAQLRGGSPVVIGLVGDTPDPFATHQVVVFGLKKAEDEATLFVYDPNAPGKTRHIWLRFGGSKAKLSTDVLTGPKKSGGYHISKKAGVLSMLFAIDV